MPIVRSVDSVDGQPLPVFWITVYADLIEATARPRDSKVVESDEGRWLPRPSVRLAVEDGNKGYLRVAMVKLAFWSLVDESVPVLPTELAL